MVTEDAFDPAPPAASPPAEADDGPLVRRGLIPRALLDDDAVAVVRRLQRFGHEAYLVGGCVRDLIAGHEPKDFDVATDARPNQIKRIFRNARIIGRRFRLAHILFDDGKVIETATFRGDPGPSEPAEPQAAEPGLAGSPDAGGEEDVEPAALPLRFGRSPDRFTDENVFGTAVEDARRRDFTVNALFYDPVGDAVIDWVGGLADLDARVIRCIGNPDLRLPEDPVRMIRAVHFAERLGFRLDPDLERSIRGHAEDLRQASGARLYVEIHKILGRGRARDTMRRLHDLGILKVWLPELTAHLDEQTLRWPAEGGGSHEEASRGEPEGLPAAHATWNLLAAADRWGLAAHGAPESLAFATLFGSWLLETLPPEAGRDFLQFADHLERTFRPIALRMSVPRRTHYGMGEILYMLLDLRHPSTHPRRVRRMVFRNAFREALALFRLDLMARDRDLSELEAWEVRARELGADPEGGHDRRPRPEADGRRRRGGRGRGRRDEGPGDEGPGVEGPGDETADARGPGAAPRIAPEADAWDTPPPPPPRREHEATREPPVPQEPVPRDEARREDLRRATPPQPARPQAARPQAAPTPAPAPPTPRPAPPPSDDFASGL